jgi:cytochrome P450
MMKPMGEVCDKTMKHLETLAEQNQVVEIKSVFQGYALDTICKCAFGIDTNAHQNQDDNQLIKAGRGVFQGLICHNWGETIFTMLFSFFPGLEKCINMFPESWDKLFDITENIISEREATSSNVHRHGDFIDRIMEVRNDPNAEVSKDLVTAQGIAFFAAGFETTSNCLSTLCYNLVQNPEIQDRIFEEIREVLESHDCIDHESIAEMNYLEAAINENLRMYPPANLQDRIASQDIEIKGMKIKKGTFVRMPIYASHHNPDFFPDPEMFKPERFLKEYADHDLIPYTWRPFSGGPRICIGLRFAMTEMKICMAKLLVKFQLEQCLETKLEFEPGDQFMLNFADVKLKLIKRT